MLQLSLEQYHSEPEGNPVQLSGKFIIDKLLTNVAHVLSAVIHVPTMNVHVSPVIELNTPPNIPEAVEPDDIILQKPPPNVE